MMSHEKAGSPVERFYGNVVHGPVDQLDPLIDELRCSARQGEHFGRWIDTYETPVRPCAAHRGHLHPSAFANDHHICDIRRRLGEQLGRHAVQIVKPGYVRDTRLSDVLHVLLHMATGDKPLTS